MSAIRKSEDTTNALHPRPFSHEWWRQVQRITDMMVYRALRPPYTALEGKELRRFVKLDNYAWARYIASVHRGGGRS